MIVKTNSGHVVKSESGKTLSRPYPTREQAQKRLREIHYFSNKRNKR